MIVPILPKEDDEKNEPIKIVFSGIFISQITEVHHDTVVKKGTRGGAPPGANPNPKYEAIWPLTKFHATNWPIAIRQLDFVNRHGCPSKLQVLDVLRWENLSQYNDQMKD